LPLLKFQPSYIILSKVPTVHYWRRISDNVPSTRVYKRSTYRKKN